MHLIRERRKEIRVGEGERWEREKEGERERDREREIKREGMLRRGGGSSK